MSEESKTRYEVQKIISDSVKRCISLYLPDQTGWGVMEFGQASFVSADKIVLLKPLRVRRLGWQGQKYITAVAGLKRVDEYIEEQHWQLHVILKKSDNPQIADMQADDVAGILVSWFNGPGCDNLRQSGVANTRIDTNQIMVYNDDSELYQKRAVFTVKIQVPKELSIPQVEMAAVKPKLMPI